MPSQTSHPSRPARARIRPYRPADARALTALIRALADYEELPRPAPAAARRLLADVGRRIHVLIAERDGAPVGYAIYLFTYSSFLARPTLYLEDVFVLPEHRRAGIGQLFFGALRAAARRARCGRMEWVVLDWNRPAHRFYRKLGARPLEGWVTYRMGLERQRTRRGRT
ncbi:MAG TPA: GNAT family N-acetyltransferase [Planctomycetota bacterium]